MADRTQITPYYSAKSLSEQFYDAISDLDPTTHQDVPFYQSLIGPSPKRCLVLGCGTGRVAIKLALAGHQVVGLDIAESMINQAETKRRLLPIHQAQRTKFLLGSMTNSMLPHWFDFAVAPFYAFNHLSGQLERSQALKHVSRHLFPAGRVALHTLTQRYLRDPRTNPPPRRPGLVLTFEEDGARVEVTWSRRIVETKLRRTTQIVEYRMFNPSGVLTASSDEALVYFWIDENSLERSAKAAGLRLISVLAGFGERPEDNCVYVMEKDY